MDKKTFKNLLLQNQKADDLGTWYMYVEFGLLGYHVYSNDDPRLTMTYLMSMSNLFPIEFTWKRS